MSDWVELKGAKPWDGRYELEILEQPLTTREWRWVKKYAGYIPMTLTPENWTDPDVVTVLAIIAMHRANRVTEDQIPDLWERLSDLPFGDTIVLTTDPDPEADARPPDRKKSSSRGSSGASSPTASANRDETQEATGSPRSATSESAEPISVT
jgi:hypothetical protein